MAVGAKEIQNMLFAMIRVVIPAFPAAGERDDSSASPARGRGKESWENLAAQEPPATEKPNGSQGQANDWVENNRGNGEKKQGWSKADHPGREADLLVHVHHG